MKKIYQIGAVLLAVMMLTGCQSAKQKVNYTEDELPYGATMKSNKTSYTIPMTYDRRFVNEDQVRAVADYLGAIQNRDAELYESVALPLYTTYQVGEVYAYQDIGELVNALHDGIASQTADDFRFQMVLINEFSLDRNAGGLNAMLSLLDSISPENAKFTDSLQNAWALELEWEFSYNNDENTGRTESQWLYLMQVDDVYYCCM